MYYVSNATALKWDKFEAHKTSKRLNLQLTEVNWAQSNNRHRNGI